MGTRHSVSRGNTSNYSNSYDRAVNSSWETNLHFEKRAIRLPSCRLHIQTTSTSSTTTGVPSLRLQLEHTDEEGFHYTHLPSLHVDIPSTMLATNDAVLVHFPLLPISNINVYVVMSVGRDHRDISKITSSIFYLFRVEAILTPIGITMELQRSNQLFRVPIDDEYHLQYHQFLDLEPNFGGDEREKQFRDMRGSKKVPIGDDDYVLTPRYQSYATHGSSPHRVILFPSSSVQRVPLTPPQPDHCIRIWTGISSPPSNSLIIRAARASSIPSSSPSSKTSTASSSTSHLQHHPEYDATQIDVEYNQDESSIAVHPVWRPTLYYSIHQHLVTHIGQIGALADVILTYLFTPTMNDTMRRLNAPITRKELYRGVWIVDPLLCTRDGNVLPDSPPATAALVATSSSSSSSSDMDDFTEINKLRAIQKLQLYVRSHGENGEWVLIMLNHHRIYHFELPVSARLQYRHQQSLSTVTPSSSSSTISSSSSTTHTGDSKAEAKSLPPVGTEIMPQWLALTPLLYTRFEWDYSLNEARMLAAPFRQWNIPFEIGMNHTVVLSLPVGVEPTTTTPSSSTTTAVGGEMVSLRMRSSGYYQYELYVGRQSWFLSEHPTSASICEVNQHVAISCHIVSSSSSDTMHQVTLKYGSPESFMGQPRVETSLNERYQ